MARWGTRPDLSPAQQYLFLKNSRVGHGSGTLNATGLVWDYRDRPTALSREYLIRIEYKRDDIPRVFVKDPDLTALAGDREIPHVYKKPLHLCLYLPSSGEWHGSMRIDQTFVPWALVWLYYFEEWLSSNEWKGGGLHPGNDQDSNQNRLSRRIAQRSE